MPEETGGVPSLSVVVPTRNRPGALATCLAALSAQRDAGAFEILVVDDGSTVAGPIARAVGKLPETRYLRQPPTGVSAARNAGARAARAPLVLFTDDDCVVQPGWAAALRTRLETGADVVAGETVAGRRDDALAAATQLVSNAVFRRDEDPWAAPASNLACRRELVLMVPFDERYGAAEERDWYARIGSVGYEVVFEQNAVVLHFPELNLARFWRKHVEYGRGAYRFSRTHRRGRVERPGFYLRLLRAGFRHGPGTGIAVLVAQLATVAGFAAEALRRSR